MASLMFSIASSNVSPWLWQPGSTGQCTSYSYSVLLMTTGYLTRLFSILKYKIKTYLTLFYGQFLKEVKHIKNERGSGVRLDN